MPAYTVLRNMDSSPLTDLQLADSLRAVATETDALILGLMYPGEQYNPPEIVDMYYDMQEPGPVDPANTIHQLLGEAFIEHGLLERIDGSYTLTPLGARAQVLAGHMLDIVIPVEVPTLERTWGPARTSSHTAASPQLTRLRIMEAALAAPAGIGIKELEESLPDLPSSLKPITHAMADHKLISLQSAGGGALPPRQGNDSSLKIYSAPKEIDMQRVEPVYNWYDFTQAVAGAVNDMRGNDADITATTVLEYFDTHEPERFARARPDSARSRIGKTLFGLAVQGLLEVNLAPDAYRHSLITTTEQQATYLQIVTRATRKFQAGSPTFLRDGIRRLRLLQTPEAAPQVRRLVNQALDDREARSRDQRELREQILTILRQQVGKPLSTAAVAAIMKEQHNTRLPTTRSQLNRLAKLSIVASSQAYPKASKFWWIE